MKLYYVNSKKERVNFYEHPYLIQDTDLLDYEYSYESEGDGRTNEILRMKREPKEKKIKIAVIADTSLPVVEKKKKQLEAANRLQEILDYDAARNIDGRIYTDTGFYLSCRAAGSQKTQWYHSGSFMFNELRFLVANPVWIREKTLEFSPGQTDESAFLDYNYDHNYDYSARESIVMLNTDHYIPSDFIMSIYGPCVNPKILIGENCYAVNHIIEDGEYCLVDNRKKTVLLHKRNGETKNLFDFRGKEKSIFDQIPAGSSRVTWDSKSGAFGFGLKIFQERSEPLW